MDPARTVLATSARALSSCEPILLAACFKPSVRSFAATWNAVPLFILTYSWMIACNVGTECWHQCGSFGRLPFVSLHNHGHVQPSPNHNHAAVPLRSGAQAAERSPCDDPVLPLDHRDSVLQLCVSFGQHLATSVLWCWTSFWSF